MALAFQYNFIPLCHASYDFKVIRIFLMHVYLNFSSSSRMEYLDIVKVNVSFRAFLKRPTTSNYKYNQILVFYRWTSMFLHKQI